MFELKPDFENVLKRYDAWWRCDITDRPICIITFPKKQGLRKPLPAEKKYANLREKWLDLEYRTEKMVIALENHVFYADALPIAWPNLGPEIFSSFYGCPLEFGESTVWSKPILRGWTTEEVGKVQLDRRNEYFGLLNKYMDILIEAGKGKFIVGYTDLHTGGDAVAAFRDPQQLCIDMIEHPGEIKSLCERITTDFLLLYDEYYTKLSSAGMPSTTWLPFTCTGKYHVPANDFSCMISSDMFEQTYLPGIVRECKHMDRCIYHLDGPQALRYLDILLAVPEIHAIQWVPGAGKDKWTSWVEVYKKIQNANKAFCVTVPAGNVEQFISTFKPQGVLMTVSGVKDIETAESIMCIVKSWK
ncbi:MAG: hypothetical protein WC955_13150 [Elusimicrobiota bacterium]